MRAPGFNLVSEDPQLPRDTASLLVAQVRRTLTVRCVRRLTSAMVHASARATARRHLRAWGCRTFLRALAAHSARNRWRHVKSALRPFLSLFAASGRPPKKRMNIGSQICLETARSCILRQVLIRQKKMRRTGQGVRGMTLDCIANNTLRAARWLER